MMTIAIVLLEVIVIFSLRRRAIRRQEGNVVGISEGGRSPCRGRGQGPTKGCKAIKAENR